MSIAPAEDLIFVIHSGQLVAWNYRTHEQFEISQEHLSALLDSDGGRWPSATEELLSTGLLQLVPQSSTVTWRWDHLSRIFHIGTSAECPDCYTAEPTEQGREYLEYCGSISDDMPPDAFAYHRGTVVRIDGLHESRDGVVRQLEELVERRKTNRTFSGEAILAGNLGAILSEKFRYRDHDAGQFSERGLATPTRRRSSPSGGSLQSCEAYVLARNVKGLEAGIYHYWSDEDALGRMGPLPQSMTFGDLAAGQMLADELSALVVVTCRFDKLAWKYPHSRAYRVALLDAGHLSQTFQLFATAHGLRTWVTGMFFDWDVRSMLQIESESHEYPLIMLGLGTGDYCPFDRYVGRA